MRWSLSKDVDDLTASPHFETCYIVVGNVDNLLPMIHSTVRELVAASHLLLQMQSTHATAGGSSA